MNLSQAKVEALGHLGLVAATLQDTQIMTKVDELLGKVENGLNYGYRVGAMVLNGLGFINTALYNDAAIFSR